MIGYLQGEPKFFNDDVIIVVNGVGYRVEVGNRTRNMMTEEVVELFTYTYVREDRLELYGFISRDQLKLFELMIGVSGVGPKTGLDIVDRDPEMIVDAVQNAKVSFFKAVPRIGKKTAQKIILELKSKLGSLKELSLGPRSNEERDVYEALLALGYDEGDIADRINKIDLEELSVEEAVKAVLKRLG